MAVAVWPRARAEAGFCTCQAAARARPSLELYLWRVRVTVRQVERRVCSNSGFGLRVRAGWVRDGGEAVLSRRSARASVRARVILGGLVSGAAAVAEEGCPLHAHR